MWIALTLLSALSYAASNVIDSLIVRHDEKHPSVLLALQGITSMAVLLFVVLAFPVRTDWWWILLIAGFSGYLADALFFYVLERLDVSVVNAAWAINAIFLSIIGFAFFHESWTLQQGIGALLVVCGVFLLSMRHTHVSLTHTLFLLIGLGLASVPFYATQKAAYAGGAEFLPIFFWSLLGREVFSFGVGFSVPRLRRRVILHLRQGGARFMARNVFATLTFIGGVFFAAAAYETGPLSLVPIVGNAQPFFVIFIAWMVAFFLPHRAAKELLSRQSVRIKLWSFGIVFLGLALLALHQ